MCQAEQLQRELEEKKALQITIGQLQTQLQQKLENQEVEENNNEVEEENKDEPLEDGELRDQQEEEEPPIKKITPK